MDPASREGPPPAQPASLAPLDPGTDSAQRSGAPFLDAHPGRPAVRLLLYVLPWLAMGWLATSQFYFFWNGRGGETMSLRNIFLWQAPPWLVFALYTPLIVRYTDRYGLGAPGRRARVLLGHAAFALFLSLQYALVVGLTGRLTGGSPLRLRPMLHDALVTVGRMVDGHLVIYCGVVALLYAVQMGRKSREQALRAARLNQQLAQAQLASLKRQLQPHFLFNTLHTIGLLVRKQDRDGAVRVLSDLGDLLRAVLDQDERQLVTLREELALLERYLAIERVRFQDRLRVELSVQPEALPLLVPNLILQPLVENALRHGLSVRDAPGWVGVRARCAGGRLHLSIEDDGVGLKAPRREGTGLRNTRERLRYLYPDEHRFELGPRDAAAERAPGVRVVLDLPARDLSPDDEPLFAPWPPVAPEARSPRIEAARGGADA